MIINNGLKLSLRARTRTQLTTILQGAKTRPDKTCGTDSMFAMAFFKKKHSIN